MRKRKKSSKHALPILIILMVSLALGGVFELCCLGAERLSHPRKYEETVTEYAALYGVPEHVVYAVIKTQSGFDSTKQGKNGEIGLFQLTPARYLALAAEAKDPEANPAALYDPETNIRYGTMYLAGLYQKYNQGWSKLSGIVRGRTLITTLTPREREVAKLAAFGMQNSEIAEKLHMSLSGVKQAVRIVSEKTGASRDEFAAYL